MARRKQQRRRRPAPPPPNPIRCALARRQELIATGVDEAAAWTTAADELVRGRPPTLPDVLRLLHSEDRPSTDVFDAAFRTFLLNRTLQYFHRHAPSVAARRSLSVFVSARFSNSALDHTTCGVLLWVSTIELLAAGGPRTLLDRCMLAIARSRLACVLSHQGDPAAQARAVELFEEQIAFFAEAAAADCPGAAEEHAKALHNLGYTWTLRAEGSRAENLRRALACFVAACDQPARQGDPRAIAQTLYHLDICHRQLAAERSANDEETRQHLAASNHYGDQARGIVEATGREMHGQHFVDGLTLADVNRETVRLRCAHQAGDLDADEFRRAMTAHAAQAAQQLAACRSANLPEFRTTLRELAMWQTMDPFESNAAVARELFQLRAQIDGGRGRLTPTQGRALLGILHRATPSQLIAALSDLDALMAAVCPVATGVENARGLLFAELAMLSSALTSAAATEALQEHIAQRLNLVHGQLSDPHLARPHRVVLAAAVRLFVSLQVAARGDALQPEEFVSLIDLSGACVTRAESTIFGQGPVIDGTLHENSQEEPRWRLGLYRTLFAYDHVLLPVALEELGQQLRGTVPEEIVKASVELAQFRHAVQGGQLVSSPVTSITDEAADIRTELAGRVEHGLNTGYLTDMGMPTPDPAAIRDWLAERPDTGILVSGGVVPQVVVARDGVLTLCPLHDSGEDIEQVLQDASADFATAINVFNRGAAFDDSGRLVPDEVAMSLPEPERARLQIAPSAAQLTALNREYERLRTVLGPLTDGLDALIDQRSLQRLVVLSRGQGREIPWEGLGRQPLRERIAIARVETLAELGTRATPVRDGQFSCVGGHDAGLALGRMALEAVGVDVTGALDVDAFEHHLQEVGVARLFVHGTFQSLMPAASRLVLNAVRMTEEVPCEAGNLRHLDLTGCGRVELWGCQTGVFNDLLGVMFQCDEPAGLGLSFLLAGARTVIGSQWSQFALPTSLIAAAFASRAAHAATALEAAAVLGNVLRDVRELLQSGGAVELACREAVRSVDSTGGRGLNSIRDCVLDAGWRAGLRELTGVDVRAAEGTGSHAFLGGPVPSPRSEQELLLRRDPDAAIDTWLEPLRHDTALAGWRVMARDLRSL